MNPALREGAEFTVSDDHVGGSVVDELFDAETSASYAKSHVLASRCDAFIARDAGDNLIVLICGMFHYWDHETDKLILLGADPGDFVTGYGEG